MTQTLTQMRKGLERSGEYCDFNRSAKAGLKRGKWGGKVTTEGRDAAHNPEVVGSNPSPATTKVPKTIGFRNFLFYFLQNSSDFNRPKSPDPNPDPKAEMGGKVRKLANHSTPRNSTAPPLSSAPLFFVFCDAIVERSFLFRPRLCILCRRTHRFCFGILR